MMVSALALTGVAYAQTDPAPAPVQSTPSGANERVTYDAAYFAQYNVQTARDMVNNTPGFTLSGGDGRRGFSGAVGNVLIDGLRPSAKSDGIGSILARIPASQVLRVELLRGADVAGDASGQAVLLNIVRTPTAGSGVFEIGMEYSGQHQNRITPRAEISYNGRNGQVEWGVGFRLHTQNRDLPGERYFYDGDGNYQGRATQSNPRDLWDPYYNASIAFPLLGGRFSATGMINPDWYNEQENHFRFFDDTDAFTGALDTAWSEEGTLSEIGLNYDRDIGAWSLALVGLRTQHPTQYNERAVESDSTGGVTETTIVGAERETTETILRGSLSRPLGTRHQIEFGGEGAINTLDSTFELIADDGSGPTPIPIPNSNVSVEEDRAEFFGVHAWRPIDQWSIETRLAWETSTLSTSTESIGGPVDEETELSFWKPSLQISRTFGNNSQLRLRHYRDVGQLNFFDFISNTSISDDRLNGGNPGLQPETDWRTEFGGDLRFPGGAALGFALTHHDIEDVNDLIVLIDDGGTPDPSDDTPFNAPGNIGDAEAWSLEMNLSTRVPFIPNSRLTVNTEFWDTEVTDPVTGEPRNISFRAETEVQISFRQDFREARWSWGIEYFKQSENQGYRLNELDTFEEGPWVDLWVETTALPNNMRLRAWAANIGNGEVVRDRRIYDTDRNGPLQSFQLTDRQFETSPWLILELSGTF
jgi:outer membrane cobalamin receptor